MLSQADSVACAVEPSWQNWPSPLMQDTHWLVSALHLYSGGGGGHAVLHFAWSSQRVLLLLLLLLNTHCAAVSSQTQPVGGGVGAGGAFSSHLALHPAWSVLEYVRCPDAKSAS
jgi:hypothetical protein